MNNKRERELLQLIERLNQYIDKEDCQPYIRYYIDEIDFKHVLNDMAFNYYITLYVLKNYLLTKH